MRPSNRQKAQCAPLIERAIEACGGRQADLSAATCGALRQQQISKLIYGDLPMTAEIAILLHRASGGAVPANELRPDLWASPEHVPLAPAVVPAQADCMSAVSCP